MISGQRFQSMKASINRLYSNYKMIEERQDKFNDDEGWKVEEALMEVIEVMNKLLNKGGKE